MSEAPDASASPTAPAESAPGATSAAAAMPGANATATTLPASPVATYPATTAADPNAPVGPAPTSPVFLDTTERCTMPDPAVVVNSGGDTQQVIDETGRLEPMLGTVVDYGGQHPDEFGGYGLIWVDTADASVFAMFTDHVAEHRAALAALVLFPDELIVCQSALTESSSRGLQTLLFNELNGRFQSLMARNGTVEIHLNATEEAAAADLEQRFGDAVTIRVGNFAYPLEVDDHTVAACNRDLTGPTEASDGVQATLAFTEPSASVGIAAHGTVTVTNNASIPFTMATGATLIGTVVDPGTTHVLGTFDGGLDALGFGATLQPGESHDLPVVIGFTSCDPTLGYTLPPGSYDVVVPVVVTYGQTPGAPSTNELVARATIEVTQT